MNDHDLGQRYENAIRRFQEHLHRREEDGTFWLDISDGNSIGVDVVMFADLTRSLEHTNEMIRRGELKPSDVKFF